MKYLRLYEAYFNSSNWEEDTLYKVGDYVIFTEEDCIKYIELQELKKDMNRYNL